MTCSSATGAPPPPPSVDGAAERPLTGALPGGVSTIDRKPAGTLTFDVGAAFGVGTPPPFCSCFIRSLIEKTLPFRGLSPPPPPLAALATDPSARDAFDVPRGESAAPIRSSTDPLRAPRGDAAPPEELIRLAFRSRFPIVDPLRADLGAESSPPAVFDVRESRLADSTLSGDVRLIFGTEVRRSWRARSWLARNAFSIVSRARVDFASSVSFVSFG